MKLTRYHHFEKQIYDGDSVKNLMCAFQQALEEDPDATINLDWDGDDNPRVYLHWTREFTPEEYEALRQRDLEVKREARERAKKLKEQKAVAEREMYLKLKAKFEK